MKKAIKKPKKTAGDIELTLTGDMFFTVTEDDGTSNKIDIPQLIIKSMLQNWMNNFFTEAIARYDPKA